MVTPSRAAVARSTRPAVHAPVDVPALTGLRAFAAIVVVLYHLGSVISAIAPSGDTVRPLLDWGMLGVDVFFVLSGFVIAHTYAHRLAAPAPGAVRDYLVARLARVYPLHLITFLAMVVLLALGAVHAFGPTADAPPTVLGFVGNLFVLQALPGIPAWNLPAWSICCELAAYLLFPLFAARVWRARWKTALAVALVALGLQLIAMHALSSTAYVIEGLFWPRIVGEFTAGAMAWVVWRHVLRPGLWADAVVAAAVVTASSMLLAGFSWMLFIPVAAASVPVVACAVGPVARLLAHPVTRWGGRISYGLYLVHMPVATVLLTWVVPAGVFTHPSNGRAVLVIGFIVFCAIVCAAVLHHGVEEPARRWLRRRFAGRRSALPASEPAPVVATA